MLAARLKANGRAFAHIAAFHPELVALRRDLHAHPELGFEEVYTSGRVKEALRLCGVDEIHEGIGKTGVVGIVRGKKSASGRMIGLRADMDALTMTEHNDFPWRSTKAGMMHGCGHDGHTAMLVGAARYLAETRNFDGTAVLIFQPGEEGFAGAKAMIDDGLFARFPVQSVFAMHNWPAMKPGTVGINSGPMMAAADRVTIEITGKGGHGAHAYLTIDPVLVAAHIITAVQSIVSRNVKPIDNAVVSLCAMQAGDLGAMSVVPGKATIVGTVRTFSPDVQELVERRLQAPPPRSRSTASIRRRSTRPTKRPSPATSPNRSSAPPTWCATWSRAWARRTSPSCCRPSRAPTCAWGRAAKAAASCTTAAMTSTTTSCRSARRCTPAWPSRPCRWKNRQFHEDV
jgi:amidohydrolase